MKKTLKAIITLLTITLAVVVSKPLSAYASDTTSVTLYHQHYGTSDQTYVSGCYKEPYTQIEKDYDNIIGYYGWWYKEAVWGYNLDEEQEATIPCAQCGRLKNNHPIDHPIYHEETVTRYKCTHSTSEIIGSLSITLNNRVLSINSSGSNLTVTGYQWKAGSTNLGTSQSYTTTSANTYTCVVTFKDNISGQSRTATLSKTTTEDMYTHTVKCEDRLKGETTSFATQTSKEVQNGVTAYGSDWGTTSTFDNAQYTYTYDSCTSIATAGTVYRYWTRKVNSYTVTYEDRVGSSTGTLLGKTTKTFDYGSTVNGTDKGSDKTRNAYYTNYTYSSSTSATVKGNTTVYRIFKLNEYTVKYDANNGTNAPSSQTKTHGTDLTITSSKPSREGWTFKGWATTTNGSVAYTSGSKYTQNADITLYANWVDDIVPTVSLSTNPSTTAIAYSKDNVIITCTAVDKETGIKGYQWYKDTQKISGATKNTYTATEKGTYKCVVTDNANNENSASVTVFIDKTNPIIASVTSDKYIAQDCAVTVNATDNLSGVKEYWYVLDGTESEHQSYEIFTVSKNGTYTFYVSDKGGNVANTTYKVDWLDNGKPSIEYVIKNPSVYEREKTVEITFKDDVAIHRYTVEGENGSTLCIKEFDYDGEYSASKGTRLEKETLTFAKNGTYTVIISDFAGNEEIKTIKINLCDDIAPYVDVIPKSSNSTEAVYEISATDNARLNEAEIFFGTDTATFTQSLNGVSDSFTYSAKYNGTYKVIITDEAGNQSTIASFTVTNIVKNYTLDELFNALHVHRGTSGTTSPNYCYTAPYQNYEVVGSHTESEHVNCGGHSIGTIGHYTCASTHMFGVASEYCGGNRTEYGWTDCNGGTHSTGTSCSRCDSGTGRTGGTEYCGGRTRYYSVDDYDYVTRYALSCTHGNETIGTLSLKKYTEGDYVLSVDTISNPYIEVVSYAWTGSNTTTSTKNTTTNTTVEFPTLTDGSLPLPSTVNGTTTQQLVVPNFGYYECIATYKDTISGLEYKVKFYYTVEDFDLEPPTVEVVENRTYGETLETVRSEETEVATPDLFKEVENEDEPYNTAWKESTTLTLKLSDNMSLMELKCVSGNLTYDNLFPTKASSREVDITFTENGTYKFELYDCIRNMYTFNVVINYIDKENPTFTTIKQTPTYNELSSSYVLQAVASDGTDGSKLHYKWMRKDLDTGEIEVYSDWSDNNSVTITDNGAYSLLFADSVYNLDVESEDGKYKHLMVVNKDYNTPSLNFYYCDTTPPKVTYDLRATTKYVLVTLNATDDYTEDPMNLKYTCDKVCKQKDNVFYIMYNGTYTFTVTDEAGNETEVEMYIDFDEMTGASPSIIKDITITPLGTHVTYEGTTYSNTGFKYTLTFKDFVDTKYVLTKWNDKGQYKNVLAYETKENGTASLFSRYTLDETVNTGEIPYKTPIETTGIDKVEPEFDVSLDKTTALVHMKDEGSGIGYMEIETLKAHSSSTSKVDYSSKRETDVTYAIQMDYNTIYGIKVYDNVGNVSNQLYVSTDGVLKGGISNLYIVYFLDANGSIISEQYLIKGANAVAPSEIPQKAGYTFLKWSCDFTNVHSNLVVSPKYVNNTTGNVLDEEVKIDEKLRKKIKGKSFMFSDEDAGKGLIDENKLVDTKVSDATYSTIEKKAEAQDIYLSIKENEVALAVMKDYVYKYSGLSLLLMMLFLLTYKWYSERKRIR